MTLHDPTRAFVPYPDVPVERARTGPLAGLSFAVKDIYDVAGYPTSGGSPYLLALSGIKRRTASAVQRLLDAGAHFVGKTISDEFAFSMNGNNIHFGAPVNAAAPERVTGGSSSGSASAVSAGTCDFAIGSDTGGSVRAPASHCNLYGIRTTHGRVSLDGALELAPSMDTFGWFARDAHTFSRVADVALGPDAAVLPDRPRILWPADVWGLLDAESRQALAAAERQVRNALGDITKVSVALDDWDAMYWSFRYVQGREAWQTHGSLLQRFSPPLGPDVAERFAWCRHVTDEQVAQGLGFRTRFREHMARLLGSDGVLLMPTMPGTAPFRCVSEGDLEQYRTCALRMLCIAGLAGIPQVTLPLARHDGAPLGISLVGPAGSDRSLIRLAAAVEAHAATAEALD